MRRCSAKPYEGDRDYIFVSYCHKDKKFVYPIIEQLAKDGYRVWYDEGIDPGSEWPEIIAQHLNDCAACIALISENSLNSHNCRREVNFTLLKKKPFIAVILEPVSMSLGMEMQLSSTQCILKYNLSGNNEFFKVLFSSQILVPCQGKPNLSINVSSPKDYEMEADSAVFSEKKVEQNAFSDKWFSSDGRKESKAASEKLSVKSAESSEKVAASQPESTVNSQRAAAFEDTGGQKSSAKSAEPVKKVEADKTAPTRSWLLRVQTNESLLLSEGEFLLGRSSSCNCIIRGNTTVSRVHASIVMAGGFCTLVDHHARNGTYLNQQPLLPDHAAPLKSGDEIRLASEKFIFFQE